MKGVCYHLTVPLSPWAECDAVVQEANALQARFGGMINHLYPSRRPGTRLPRYFWGIMHWPRLRWAERYISLHHFYNPDPYPFAVLRLLRRPVIYTVSAGVQEGNQDNARRLAKYVQTVVVATDAERERLLRWGIKNVARVRSGIDLTRFTSVPLPPELPPTILMGSAPWTAGQFHTKGVDVLLALAHCWPELHLVFLWRNILYEEMMHRVHTLGLSDRVEVINKQANVNGVLARVHAAIILATEDALIKAYPHSLLEALAAGKPILVSRTVPMATEVIQQGYGVVIDEVSKASVQGALKELFHHYPGYQQRVLGFDKYNFTLERMLANYAEIYSRW